MIQIKTDWKKISISEYFRIRDILMDKSMDDTEKDVEIMAVLGDTEPENIWNLTIGDIQVLKAQMSFLKDFDFDKNFNAKKIKLGENTYWVQRDVNKFTYAQFVDFQEYFRKNKDGEMIAEIVSTLIIPEGHTYNDGYDLAAVIDDIKENMDICTANAVCFFFRKEYVRSIKTSLFFLRATMRMMKGRMTEEMRQQMIEIQDRVKEIQYTGGFAW